jgi:hypothetical protein
MRPLPIFVGFDPREASAYHVCAQSIIEHSTVPVAIIPLALRLLDEYAETHGDGSNDFIYSRFLVPYLMRFTGHALFIDGDMLVRGDVAELFGLARADKCVQVVKHDYRTKYATKYLGAKNEDYPFKNWSSVMLWNCASHPNRVLTPEYVRAHSGAHLHRFQWLQDERIGDLPAEWNHLTMEYAPAPNAKIAHFTIGTPCFPGYEQQEHGTEWWDTLSRAVAPVRHV